jgi:hypothetical protein
LKKKALTKALIAMVFILAVFGVKTVYFAEILKKIAPGKDFVAARMNEPGNWIYLKITLGLFIAFCVFYLNKIRNYIKCFKKALYQIIFSFKRYWANIPGWERRIFLVTFAGIFIFRFYWMLTLPITHDEASTYVNFSGRGLLYAMGYYTAPNNHILNSVLAFFTCKIPVKDTLALRIPTFLAGISAVAALWFLLRRYSASPFLSLCIWGIYSYMFFLTDYGVMARGYSFVLLFFILAYYAVLSLCKNETNEYKFHWLLVFTMASIAGFYAIPTYLYAHATLCLIYGVYNYKNIKSLLIFARVNLLIIAAVMLLYLPVVLISGLDSLIHNRYVERVSSQYVLENLYAHFTNTFSTLFTRFDYYIPIIFLSFFLLIIKQKNLPVISAIIILMMAPLLIVLQGVVPFERTWIYLSVPALLLLLTVINMLAKYKEYPLPSGWFVFLYACLISLAGFRTHQKMKYDHSEGMSAWELKEMVYSEINKGHRVISMDYISHTILDYYRLRNKVFNLELYRPESWNTSADAAFLIPKNTIIITQKEVGEKYINRVQDGWRLKRLGVVYNVYENKQ